MEQGEVMPVHRGRSSAAELEVGAADVVLEALEPPAYLINSQKVIWREIVATKPPDWFNADSAPLLEAYCKSVDHYRKMSRMLDNMPKDVDDIAKLSKLVTAQAHLICQLATKMRLTQQSRYLAKTAHRRNRDITSTPHAADKPWND
jgi:hypothetical protein